jgi:alanine racemase
MKNLTWVEISKKALLNNVAEIKKLLDKKTKLIAIVKSNAYGHGLLQVAKAIKNKVDAFGVYDFDDAILLRVQKIEKPILMLGRVFADQIDLAIKNKIEISVSNLDILQAAKKILGDQKLMIHLCVETGLGRDGFVFDDMKKILPLLKNKNIEVVGLYTHLAAPDSSDFLNYTKNQIGEFLKWQKALAQIGLNPQLHVSSTAATFISEIDCVFDAVRIGGGIYGLWSSDEIFAKNHQTTKLIPALSWKTRVIEIKNLPKGSCISYGCTFQLKRDSKIAILPIGYFDGIPRVSSNKGQVIINGKKLPQLGRVTMNMLVIDATDLPKIKVGDIATIIGTDKKQIINAKDWGDWSNSFHYEITTRINCRINRVLL